MNWKKWSLLFALILGLGLVLAACGGDKTGGEKKNNNEQSENSGENEGSASEGAEQVLNVNIKSEPPSLHPGLATDTTSGAVLYQVFEGLMRINQEGVPEPAMAVAEPEVSDDLLTYTFTIRDDAKWSNGDPVTAHDFEYAWKWVLDPANADTDYAYQLYVIKGAQKAKEEGGSLDEVGVKAKDDKTLEVTLEQPTPYFLDLTAFYTYFPVNKNVVDGNDKWALEASDAYVSNGPFLLESWSHKDKIVLKKNPTYWDADTVKLETINMYMIEDENTALEMFNAGDLDWVGSPTDSVPLAARPKLKEEGKLNITPLAGVYYYAFNTEEAPFDNPNIRKAFALAINRQGIVENITKSEQIPAMALVPPSIWEESKEGYFADNDVEKAKEYLEKGLEELNLDKLPKIKLSYNTDEAHAVIAQAIQDMWSKGLGVEVELNNEEWNVYLDTMGSGNFQVGRMGWLADFNDAINFLEIFQSVGGNNYTNWEDAEYKELLAKSRTETDPAARKAILREAEAIFMEALPIAPIYFYTNVWTAKDYVKGIEVSGLGDAQYKWGYIEK
ncbi:peptide ABC transporter substrate-binding protein [Ornithinibacillus bavariensis]|uniref:Oligopeptide-binding protein OppA n=1 Tax=Ornithinibacillus bavariensis TaxID=545502 RepID=A0A919X909_9BACI|nr:peptide ABC transporter substrate-binding protein [Ornithinibacillus bavariensis]GIO26745.1 oligopeptide-binding protein OppA [Ornithinibacillus bavariensis]HAM80806.1 ABC transporter substrate-binding protein [Ornithinibacillus sp.]